MAREKKQAQEIKTDGWKDTFSDLMNLLLCFFVLLFSMSNVDTVKYAELVASMSNSFSIFQGGAQALGEGTLISSGATQLSNLDDYYTDMGKASESDVETDPAAAYEKQKQLKKQESTEELYSEIVEKTETNRIEDALDVTMDDGYNYVMLSLSGGVLFESGSAEIQSGAKQILSRVATILKSYEDRQIKIEGHTDNVPINNAEYNSNLWLSTARATKVLEYLVEKKNLSEKHLEASGRGDVDPIASNKTAAGRAKNRRVEIKIYNDVD
ncbi:MAG: flagellar motor protein MotB [Butyribacter sp.]|nr:flagellar motor protein MotB [bacterium]MDY3855257.1 flagellar motor protein MotB [Butyribacter sp.]